MYIYIHRHQMLTVAAYHRPPPQSRQCTAEKQLRSRVLRKECS